MRSLLLACFLINTAAIQLPLGKGVDEANIKLELKSGSLHVSGGSNELLYLDYSEHTPPEIHANGKGKVDVKGNNPGGEWNAQINNGLPTELEIKTRAAEIGVDLSDSKLEELKINSTGGAIQVSLNGQQALLKEVEVDQKSGTIVLKLNGNFPALKEIDLESTVGDLQLQLSGSFEELKEIDLETSAGRLAVSMEGAQLGRTATLNAKSVSGDLEINLPAEAGVRAKVAKGSHKVSAPGYSKESDERYEIYRYDPSSSRGQIYLNLRGPQRIELHSGQAQ